MQLSTRQYNVDQKLHSSSHPYTRTVLQVVSFQMGSNL